MCIMFLVKILKMTLIITLMITVDFRSSVTLDSVERAGWWLPGHSKVSTMEQLKVYSHCTGCLDLWSSAGSVNI